MKKPAAKTNRGRPREFDADVALDAALHVFWKKGFDGTSLPDLTRAMGINRPSLYAVFGNKESLFRKAVDRYAERGNKRLTAAMSLPTARESIEAFLRGGIGPCSPAKPRGCLLVQGALCGGETSEPVRRDLICRREAIEIVFRQRFERAISEGEKLPVNNPAVLARYFATVMHGLSVQAAGTATRNELLAVVAAAMLIFSLKVEP